MKKFILLLAAICLNLFAEPFEATCQRDDQAGVVLCNDAINGNLVWQDEYNLVTKNQSEARRYCENLNYAGYSNWKLPSLEQMLSIIDRSRREPAINPAFKYTNSKQY